MEDAYAVKDGSDCTLYAVFDGHSGDGAVLFAATHLLNFLDKPDFNDASITAAFIHLERFYKTSTVTAAAEPEEGKPPPLRLNHDSSGTCATVAIRRGDELTIANVGDCTALLISYDGSFQVLSRAHRLEGVGVEEETARIEAAGMYVESKRVIGELAVSRSIGDFRYKGNQLEEHLNAVTCVPYITHVQLTAQHKCLLLFSDGISDGITNEKLRDLVMTAPRLGAQGTWVSLQTVLVAAVQEAYQVSRDNTVLMCIEL
jgi:serine/threonine protein phosphatase PrpC